jgi:hypothetical protein
MKGQFVNIGAVVKLPKDRVNEFFDDLSRFPDLLVVKTKVSFLKIFLVEQGEEEENVTNHR